MKKLYMIISIMLLTMFAAVAQAPERFSYQAVVRNANNSLVANANVGVRVSILQGGATGNSVYTETHTAGTNANGLLTLEVCGGNAQQGSFQSIDWGSGNYFLKTEVDPNGGSNYSITSVQQLMSVPYALYAKEAANSFSGDYNDLTNVPSIPTVPTNVSTFTNDAGYITAGQVPAQVNADWDATSGAAEILNKPTLFSGSYNDLTDKPTIPEEANNATLTIQRNESLVGTFTADASTNTTINIVVPTTTSDLVNNSGYITAADIPEIPTNVSAFTNDAGYLTTAQCGDIDICDLAELVAQLQQQVATLQQQIDSLQGQSGQDTTINPIDTTTILLPTVFTSTASNITSTSAMVGGNVTSDGGASVIARGVCWSTSQNPTVNDSHTTDGGGMGSFTSNITGLAANTIYYVRAYATNSAGTAYGEEVTFTTLSAGGTAVIDEKSCPEAQTVTDHEGNEYATVQIGNQCWMRDNLRTTTSPSTGTYLIPAVGTGYTYTGKQARWYNNDSATYAPMNYGLLYNWNAAVDTFNTAYGETSVNTSSSYTNAVGVTFSGHRRGICPAGWHLPSDAEWMQLGNYVGSQSEYPCGGNSSDIAKALASTEGWITDTDNCAVGNDPSSNNATGFSAVPAGFCDGSSFFYAGRDATFWSSTQYYYDAYAWWRGLHCSSANVQGGTNAKSVGYPVRCLRD